MGQRVGEETRPWIPDGKLRRVVSEKVLAVLARRPSEQEIAKVYIETIIETLLQGRLPSDQERASTLSECAQACEKEGLDLSMVLQEMSIEGYTPS
jgi:hypothetical protein